MDAADLSIAQAGARLRSGDLTAVDLLGAVQQRRDLARQHALRLALFRRRLGRRLLPSVARRWNAE